jgi:hypothetical protein
MLTILLKNWQLVAIGLLLAALAGSGLYINLLKSQKETVVAEKNLLTAALEVSQGSVKSLQQAIVDQNTAIEKFKSAADERVKINAAAIAKAKSEAAVSKKIASDLLKRKPDPTKPICESANDLFNEEIQNAK